MAKSILYLITSFSYGGAQKNLFELARRARDAGFNVAVASIKDGGIYEEKFKDIGVACRTLGVPSDGRKTLNTVLSYLLLPFFYLRAFIRLLLFAEDVRAEIIHSFLFQANILGRVASKYLGIKSISSERVLEREKKWQVLVLRLTNFMTEIITVNSHQLFEFAASHYADEDLKKIVLINNYVDLKNIPHANPSLRREFGFSDSDFLVVSSGRLSKQKGFEYLIRAAGLIKDEIPDLRVLIVGDGELKSRLLGIIKELHLEEIVLLAGAREDADALIASGNLFVLPSLWEGFPNVVLEAIASRIPVIATDTSCVEGFIEDDFIVKSSDAVSIAQKILEIYRDRRKAYLSVEKSAAKLTEYSSEEIFTRYFDIYKNL